jgi:hypothetical protein
MYLDILFVTCWLAYKGYNYIITGETLFSVSRDCLPSSSGLSLRIPLKIPGSTVLDPSRRN